MANKTIKVAVTGAAGQIGYALLFRIASGHMFGEGTDVELQLLELEAALPALNGVKMELDDCAFPLLKKVTCTSDMNVAFKDTDWCLLVGSVPRKEGMERADLLKINGGIFTKQGQAIAAHGKKTCKVLVVGNPCNTNALIGSHAAKGMDKKNWFAMTMLDQNRATTQLAQKAGVDLTAVENVAIWGNHSPTMFSDFNHAKISGKKVTDVISDQAWLQTTFLETVGKRGAAIIKARGLSSAASAANAVVDTVRNLMTPTPAGKHFSVAVNSDGNPYGTPANLMFSYPIVSKGDGNWEIVKGMEHDAFAKGKIEATTKELLDEREAIKDMLA